MDFSDSSALARLYNALTPTQGGFSASTGPDSNPYSIGSIRTTHTHGEDFFSIRVPVEECDYVRGKRAWERAQIATTYYWLQVQHYPDRTGTDEYKAVLWDHDGQPAHWWNIRSAENLFLDGKRQIIYGNRCVNLPWYTPFDNALIGAFGAFGIYPYESR